VLHAVGEGALHHRGRFATALALDPSGRLKVNAKPALPSLSLSLSNSNLKCQRHSNTCNYVWSITRW
jgi:hypothetical protein